MQLKFMTCLYVLLFCQIVIPILYACIEHTIHLGNHPDHSRAILASSKVLVSASALQLIMST